MSRSRSDILLSWMLRASAGLAGGIVLLIIAFLVIESLPALRDVGVTRFFNDRSWHPDEDVAAGRFNLTPMLVGTLASTAGAVLLATPLGIASAMFCTFYAPRRVGAAYRRVIQLLAGIPSVVFGFWGLVILAPLIRQLHPPGQCLLTGILILTVMILPTIALLSESALRTVPRAHLQAAASMGLSRWATIRGVAIPSARSGLLTAMLLATGRAIGETMAVLMVAGNVVQMPRSIFDPIRTLTANIALELGYAMEIHRAALFVAGLVLMMMIAALVGMAEWISRGRLYG